MGTNRRQFIRTAGMGVLGLGIRPVMSDFNFFSGKGEAGSLPRATPESKGVSSSSISNFIVAAEASGISWHSFMLVRRGHVVAEGWWKPYEPEYVHSLYSLSKSFTSTAIGFLVKEGKLDIHAKLVSFFPDDLPANVSDHLRAMTVKHLLTMNTGHGADTLPAMREGKDSWVRTYLAQPVDFEPGTHFLYNTGNTYMLGAILYGVTGKTLEEYLEPRLFEPLGIRGYDWERSPQGLNTAGYGLRVHTEDIAKLGQLYLQKGKWEGVQLLPAAWVEEATSAQTTSQVNNGDWSEGYGYQFWRCTHGFYRGDGAHGQFCIVMPELDAVLAVTGQSPDMQRSLNIIWEHIATAMKAGPMSLPEGGGQQAKLRAELAGLQLPVVKGVQGDMPQLSAFTGKYRLEDNPFGLSSLSVDISAVGVTLSAEGKDGQGGGVLKFGWENWVTGADRQSYVFNSGGLAPMPTRVAGTACRVDDHTIQLNVRLVEAIFGDRITCVFEGARVRISFLNSLAEMSGGKTKDDRPGVTGVSSVS